MRPVIVPRYRALLGVVEVTTERPVTRLGVYDSGRLRETLRVLESLEAVRDPWVELAFTPTRNGLNALLVRPAEILGHGWIAVAPIDPDGYPAAGWLECEEEDDNDNDILEVD